MPKKPAARPPQPPVTPAASARRISPLLVAAVVVIAVAVIGAIAYVGSRPAASSDAAASAQSAQTGGAAASTAGTPASTASAEAAVAADVAKTAALGPHKQETLPPLPFTGYPPARPADVVRAAYTFAAEHPEILSYVPCYCGCEASGHRGNDDCFVAARAPNGDVTAWEPHGVT